MSKKTVRLPTAVMHGEVVETSSSIVLADAVGADYSGATSDEHFVSLWLGRHQSSPHTARSYSRGASRFLAFLAARGKGLRTTKLVDLDAWQAELTCEDERRRPTPAGQKYIMSAHTRQQLAVVKSLLAKGRATGYLPFDVGAALELPRARDVLSERLLTVEELDAVLKAAAAADAAPDEEPMVRLLYYLGCRVSELVQLQWKNVVTRPGEGAIVTIHGKGEKTRHVFLDAEQAAVLLALRPPDRSMESSEQYVFASCRGGKHIHATTAWRLVRAAVDRSGIGRKASPHWFRHAHASHALDAGAPPHLVQKHAGPREPSDHDEVRSRPSWRIVEQVPEAVRRERTMIYFLRAVGTDFVKVGYTAEGPDMPRRIAALQMGCPHKLRTEAVCPGAGEDERRMHHMLEDKHMRGEWFRLSPEEVSSLAVCPPAPPDPGVEPSLPSSWIDEIVQAMMYALDSFPDWLTITPGKERLARSAMTNLLVGRLLTLPKDHANRVVFFLDEHRRWEQAFGVWAKWQELHGDGVARTCRQFRLRQDSTGVELVVE